MSRVQWSLFAEEPPAPPPDPAGLLRRCASCDQIEAPADARLVALGLWHCKRDGAATFRSTQRADGSLRVCDWGMRDADK